MPNQHTPLREQSTFLVADLAGYTALTQAHGDDRAADIACSFTEAVAELASAYDSDNVKTIGDAILLRLADPTDAIHLAARITSELGARNRTLGVRVGIATGTAVQRSGDWFGSAVNTASRVADLATSGEILMTGTTHAQVMQTVPPAQLEPRGHHTLKNLAEEVEIFALVAPAKEQTLPVDPVCRMAVLPHTATHLDHGGRSFYFCSSECAQAFHEHPDRYLTGPPHA